MKQTMQERSLRDPRAAQPNAWLDKILPVINLRPDDVERTLYMFAFYTTTSVGMLWLEQTTIAIFLEKYKAEGLPLIYIASAVMGSGLGVIYSWLQNTFPLRKVFIIIGFLMSLPLFVFRIGIDIQAFYVGAITVFVLRLWMDAEEILNDLNTQVAANQLFNIREIKRTYPIIASGLLLGDVIAGFSLPVVLKIIGLNNVMLLASVTIASGAVVLQILSKRYKQAFPDTPVRDFEDEQTSYSARRNLKSYFRYIIPLFGFFILGELLFLLVEFEYLGELEFKYETDELAGFLGLFNGFLGIFELLAQWFVTSHAVERLGAFVAAMFLPISLSVLGAVTLVIDKVLGLDVSSAEILFFGVVALKFFDELLRYTLIAGIEPFLFQPLPSEIRSRIQTLVQGIAEPMTTGLTGLGILGAIALIAQFFGTKLDAEQLRQLQGGVFIGAIVLFSSIWALSAWLLRSTYVGLLVQEAERGRLGFDQIDLKAFKREIEKNLRERDKEEDQSSCIAMLEQIALREEEECKEGETILGPGEILAPMLLKFSPKLQRQSLDVMLRYPNAVHLPYIQKLIERKPPLEVLSLALRYIWLSQPNLDTHTLKPYLQERVDPIVRGSAASLILSRGESYQQPEALTVLEQMLTSERERERVIGAKMLQDISVDSPLYAQYIPELLQDESSKVRCALLEVIGEKQLIDYYPSLIKGLVFKSTRDAAKRSLIRMKDKEPALNLLMTLGMDTRSPEFMRLQVWNTMAEMGTTASLDRLVNLLVVNWGINRRNLLRILVKMPGDRGIESVLERLGRGGVESLIEQELLFIGQLYGSLKDLNEEDVPGNEGVLLRESLKGMASDVIERCFLLMRILYPSNQIQAAILNLDSDSQTSIALGLEIMDNTIDIPQKQVFLELLESGLKPKMEKLKVIESLVPYNSMSPSNRLRHLLEFRHFLSDWTVACCFHLARSQHWSVTKEATLVCLRHPVGFVREAVLGYLKAASPRICLELLPVLKNDPDPLVAAQVEQMRVELASNL